ncbi:class III extradiol dioxygenase subunit B-like domain-containing protein [Micromonospora antibiotica]|uniref:Class III extradiol dioxygenase subunit B-like domain-containing protein n=1 Tax=Micromonospora antibiotica TaxID=2807623 RepID=A0ABS3VEG4_9ACTN|nr:class III extradiol dioxygenase subunit B-like domain-containing protein [Micromonospora antibiotica]MBO4164023.1 class III extradiol dioxygenase subunit B-like domain-containing protein [Micromonospora antibiotica]
MPLVAAAVCPHPPLIVPELAGAAAPELAELRAACTAAVTALHTAGAGTVVLVGAGELTVELDLPRQGSFAPWGLPLAVRLGGGPAPADPGSGDDRLPLSLLVGAWLVDRVVPPASVAWRMVSIGSDEPVDRCAALGAGLRVDGPWALLVLGDGSSCHGPKAPGYDDPRAGAYDEGVARALADADTDALLGLDPVVSAQLGAAGRPAWQVLAGAVREAGGDWRGELRHHSHPYGVGYLVASWSRPAGTGGVGTGGAAR